MKRKRTKQEVQADLDQHNRNVSWTLSRAGADGRSLDKEVIDGMLKRSEELKAELKTAK